MRRPSISRVTFNTAVTGFDQNAVYVYSSPTAFNYSSPTIVVPIQATIRPTTLPSAVCRATAMCLLRQPRCGVRSCLWQHEHQLSRPGYRPLRSAADRESRPSRQPRRSNERHADQLYGRGQRAVGRSGGPRFCTGSTVPGTLAAATISGGGYDGTTNTFDYNIAVTGMTGDGLVVCLIFVRGLPRSENPKRIACGSTRRQPVSRSNRVRCFEPGSFASQTGSTCCWYRCTTSFRMGGRWVCWFGKFANSTRRPSRVEKAIENCPSDTRTSRSGDGSSCRASV